MSLTRRPELGLAVGPRRITAVGARRGSAVTVEWAPPPEGQDPTEALVAGFESAAAKLGVETEEHGGRLESFREARVSVALLPPLADVRLVDLPPLRREESEAVLRRDASRYFVGGSGARVVGVHDPASRRTRSSDAPEDGGADPSPGGVLAAAAPHPLVEGIRRASDRLGWELDRIVPAYAAWLAAAGGGSGGAARLVAAVHDGVAHLVRVGAGGPTMVRRLPSGTDADVVGAAGPGPGVALLLAEATARSRLERALAAAGWSPRSDRVAGMEAAEAAAAFAAQARLELVPPTLAEQRGRRVRRRALTLGAVAALLLVAAAGIRLWGAQRELDEVLAQRAAIQDQVVPLLEARDSIARLEERVREVDALVERSPRWTRALFDLAMLLPSDTHLTGMEANQNYLEIEAAGARAGEAIQALRASTALADVRLVGIVERELEDGATVVERFRLAARLVEPEGSGDGREGDAPLPGRER